MIVLGIETSAARGSVAVSTAGAMAERDLTEERGQARELAQAVDELLQAAGLRPRDLQGIAVGLGPGAYTGMRLASATAQVLGFTLGCPVVGVASPAAMVRDPAVPVGSVLVALDARQGLVYAARYHKDAAGAVVELEPPACRVAAEVAESLGDAYVVGDGHAVLAAHAGRALAGDASLAPRARWVLELGRIRLERGESDPPAALQPLYLRPSEAEIRWRQRRGEEAARQGKP